MMLRVHITSDERGEGKTVLASYLFDFLNGLGHNVTFESESPNERLYYPDNDLIAKDVIVSTDNSHLPWRIGDDLAHVKFSPDWPLHRYQGAHDAF